MNRRTAAWAIRTTVAAALGSGLAADDVEREVRAALDEGASKVGQAGSLPGKRRKDFPMAPRPSRSPRWRGWLDVEGFDAQVDVDGPTIRAVVPVTWDGESVVLRDIDGREWHFGLADFHEAIGWETARGAAAARAPRGVAP